MAGRAAIVPNWRLVGGQMVGFPRYLMRTLDLTRLDAWSPAAGVPDGRRGTPARRLARVVDNNARPGRAHGADHRASVDPAGPAVGWQVGQRDLNRPRSNPHGPGTVRELPPLVGSRRGRGRARGSGRCRTNWPFGNVGRACHLAPWLFSGSLWPTDNSTIPRRSLTSATRYTRPQWSGLQPSPNPVPRRGELKCSGSTKGAVLARWAPAYPPTSYCDPASLTTTRSPRGPSAVRGIYQSLDTGGEPAVNSRAGREVTLAVSSPPEHASRLVAGRQPTLRSSHDQSDPQPS